MGKETSRAICTLVLCALLAGCSQPFLPSAIGVPAGAVISPPVTVLEKKSPDEAAYRPAPSGAPHLSLLPLKDQREFSYIIRSVKGYQGWFYHATGWKIDTRERVDEIVTASVRHHLEKSGIRTAAGPDRKIPVNLEGEVRKFYVNKTGNLEDSWEAFVEITLRMNTAGQKKPLKVYTLTGYAEQYNWRGAASGAQALTEALEEAVKQIPAEDIRVLAERFRHLN